MQFDWQLIAALGIVALATAYVARLTWKSLRGKSSGCGGCGTCKANPADEKGSKLVMLSEAEEIASGR